MAGIRPGWAARVSLVVSCWCTLSWHEGMGDPGRNVFVPTRVTHARGSGAGGPSRDVLMLAEGLRYGAKVWVTLAVMSWCPWWC